MSELKKIRLFDKKISQFELSRRSGVHPSRLSLIENGLTVPTAGERKKISEAIGMPPEEIFGEVPKSQSEVELEANTSAPKK
jgi:transcriptional regulator with XRE-family HTH domain